MIVRYHHQYYNYYYVVRRQHTLTNRLVPVWSPLGLVLLSALSPLLDMMWGAT